MISSNLSEQVQQLFDFTKPVNIELLEKILEMSVSANPDEAKFANEVISKYQEHHQAWTVCDKIISGNCKYETKFFALRIMENTIHEKWRILPEGARDPIKKFVVNSVIGLSSDTNTYENKSQSVLLTKLNMVLIQLLQHEWPQNWESFIPDLISSSQTNIHLCYNNMRILKLLSEEVFDFAEGNLSSTKQKRLKESIKQQFEDVYRLCMFVMANSQEPKLINATLETFIKFLSWIPYSYAFNEEFVQRLLFHLFPLPIFRNNVTEVLTEVISIRVPPGDQHTCVQLIQMALQQVKQMVPLQPLVQMMEGASPPARDFIRNLTIFLTTSLKIHLPAILKEEKIDEYAELAVEMHQYLIYISEIDDTELFKICLEYWGSFCEDLYKESPHTVSTNNPFMSSSNEQEQTFRRRLFGSCPFQDQGQTSSILTLLRQIMIAKMVKPEEVLVVETSDGELIREFMPPHTDHLNTFKQMKQTLVYLTHLDYVDTKNIMETKLVKITDDPDWKWNDLNTLCWAIGAISGAMGLGAEKCFIITVIRHLLQLCEGVHGKSHKAVVASNIMYVCGQYPRFLRAHWKFLKVVVKKCFEFMHETHEGVQDMSCDTFVKIAKQCRRLFVMQQMHETEPFVETVISDMPQVTIDLEANQVCVFYEAVGHMITSQNDPEIQKQLISKLMAQQNIIWQNSIQQIQQNRNVLEDVTMCKNLCRLLQINIRTCDTIGSNFTVQISAIYQDMMNLYQCLTFLVNEMIKKADPSQVNLVIMSNVTKKMLAVKRDILRLIKTYIKHNSDINIAEKFLGNLLQTTLPDYKDSPPDAKEAEVLLLLSQMVETYQHNVTNVYVQLIFEHVFDSTLGLIMPDNSAYPTHRINFYTMLEAMSKTIFKSWFVFSADQFKRIIDSIVKAIGHETHAVSLMGLAIVTNMFKVESSDVFAQQFYSGYYLFFIKQIFKVMTDSLHKYALHQHCSILIQLVKLVDQNLIKNPLAASVTDNKQYIKTFLPEILMAHFPALQLPQVQTFMEQLFAHYHDEGQFRAVIQDFLIQIRVYADQSEIEAQINEARSQMEKAKNERNKNSGIMSNSGGNAFIQLKPF